MSVSYDYDRETGQYTEHEPLQLVDRVSWHDHYLFMAANWKAGEHVSIVCQTGGGKSYLFVHGLAPLLEPEQVILFDVKGDDDELNGLKLRHIRKLPSRLERRMHGEKPRSHWYHYMAIRQDETRTMLDTIYQTGHMTIVLDETRAITDTTPNGLGLAGVVDNMWMRGRSRELTIIAGTQAPRFVPSAFYEQARHLYIGHLLDRRAQRRLEEIGGDSDAIEDVVGHLARYEYLYIGPLQEDATRTMQIVRVPGPENASQS